MHRDGHGEGDPDAWRANEDPLAEDDYAADRHADDQYFDDEYDAPSASKGAPSLEDNGRDGGGGLLARLRRRSGR